MDHQDLIKPDPEAATPSPPAFADEDIYEDAGDLEFNTDTKFQKLYLARMPKYVWDNWSKLDDDAEIHIGTIRQSTVTGSNGVGRVYPVSRCLVVITAHLSR
jgi:transcription initiation factor TFIIF subunit beta